jgi:stage IV sporulation protein A
VLHEFPIREIKINFDKWVDVLDGEHWLYKSLSSAVKNALSNITKISSVNSSTNKILENEYVSSCNVADIDMGRGAVTITVSCLDNVFYKVLGESSGFEIQGQNDLIKLMCELSSIKKEYDKISYALDEVSRKGYGIVSPTIDELTLEEPEIIKQGGRFGVRLKASAPSIHMIRADIETEVNPIVGTEKQSEELVHYLLQEFEIDPKKIWQTNIFGKSLHELVNEGLHNKLYRMPDDAQVKLQETLQKIINEGSGGLICIIL